jgi:hypothetical protein
MIWNGKAAMTPNIDSFEMIIRAQSVGCRGLTGPALGGSVWSIREMDKCGGVSLGRGSARLKFLMTRSFESYVLWMVMFNLDQFIRHLDFGYSGTDIPCHSLHLIGVVFDNLLPTVASSLYTASTQQ